MRVEDKTYNGWTNYETWVTALWIDNEEGSYYYSRELVAQARIDSKTSPKPPHILLAEALRQWMMDSRPRPRDSWVWGDLLRHALDQVNWYEIAVNYLEEET